MFRPESDWTDLGRHGVEDFSIDHRLSLGDVDIDVRSFRWTAPTSGIFSPAKHFINYSLTHQTRRSLIDAEPWGERQAAGDILYLPPDQPYRGEPAMQDMKIMCVALGDGFVQQVLEDDRQLAGLMPCSDVRSPALRRLLEAMATEIATPGFASATLVEAMTVGVLVELVRHLRRQGGPVDEGASATPRQIRMISDYVMGNLSGTLSVADIARECGMSTRHVARVFKDATGVSLGDFVARSRISLAKELLASDDVRIKEVSWRCGFRSTSAFSAAFRSATGTTPREFRTGTTSLQ